MSEATAAGAAAESRRVAPGVPYGVSFAELVWAHYLRQRELDARPPAPYEGESEQRFRRFLAAFERDHGRIVDAYWCSNVASAVAVTAKPRRFLHRLGWAPRYRFHRVTDWATRGDAAVARLLQDYEVLAVRAGEVLRGTSQRLTVERVYSAATLLLGFVDRDVAPGEDEANALVVEQKQELEEAQRDYQAAAQREAQIVYFWGMVQGILIQAALAGLVALFLAKGMQLLWNVKIVDEVAATYFSCFAAGTLGGVVSVLSRMTSSQSCFSVDYEIGRKNIRALGSFRPFVGGVFGLAVAFAIASDAIDINVGDDTGAGPSFYFLAFAAFVAGFSERFAKDIFDDAGGRFLKTKPKPAPVPAGAAGDVTGDEEKRV